MFSKLTPLLLFTFVLSVSAQFADFVPQLTPRSVRPSGGWSLSQGTCPTDAPQCGSSWCCPSSTTCVHTGGGDIAEVCCSGSVDCLSAFQAGPFCADDTWSLWNSTTDTSDSFGYFCCLPGQVGMQNGDCVTPDLISASTQLAQELSPGGSATAGSSSSSTSSSSGSSGTESSSSSSLPATTTSTTNATTSSAAAVTTSTSIGIATPFSHSAPSTTTTASSLSPSSNKPVSSSSATPTTTFAQASSGEMGAARIGAWGIVQGVMGIIVAVVL